MTTDQYDRDYEAAGPDHARGLGSPQAAGSAKRAGPAERPPGSLS
jgi:hypothetical protein